MAMFINRRVHLPIELCEQLGVAGFPNHGTHITLLRAGVRSRIPNPSLSELIKESGLETENYPWGENVGQFRFCLQYAGDKWRAGYKDPTHYEAWDNSDFEVGKTPEEAVANLWLELNRKL